jgi:hypothetical protein
VYFVLVISPPLPLWIQAVLAIVAFLFGLLAMVVLFVYTPGWLKPRWVREQERNPHGWDRTVRTSPPMHAVAYALAWVMLAGVVVAGIWFHWPLAGQAIGLSVAVGILIAKRPHARRGRT